MTAKELEKKVKEICDRTGLRILYAKNFFEI